jgi:hypothetical protein
MATIDGIEIFPIISLVLFFILFVGMSILVMRITKEDVADMELLPLQDELADQTLTPSSKK